MSKKEGIITTEVVTKTFEGILRGWIHYGYTKCEIKIMFRNALDRIKEDTKVNESE